jgi:hypothetical protein
MAYTLKLLRAQGIEPTMILLLDRIKKRATVTYGEIARMLPKQIGIPTATVFPTHIGAVAGTLMDRIRDHFPKAPLINLLIVNQTTGLPSGGCDPYLDSLPGMRLGAGRGMQYQARKRLIHELWQQVYAYPAWDDVFRQLFKHSPPAVAAIGIEEFREQDGKPGTWGGRQGGESVHHKRLKNHVLDNPHLLSITAVMAACTEQKLLSGDSVDVFIATAKGSYVIEVKSWISSDDDIKRGLYQCLKYRIVVAAQQERSPDDRSIIAKLVVERNPPADLWELARRLGIKIHVIRVNPDAK